jgi:hypothetical protein
MHVAVPADEFPKVEVAVATARTDGGTGSPDAGTQEDPSGRRGQGRGDEADARLAAEAR